MLARYLIHGERAAIEAMREDAKVRNVLASHGRDRARGDAERKRCGSAGPPKSPADTGGVRGANTSPSERVAQHEARKVGRTRGRAARAAAGRAESVRIAR